MFSLVSTAPEAVACLLCSRPLPSAIGSQHRALERDLLLRLRRRHLAWRTPDAICPECVRTGQADLRRHRSDTSLHHELGHSYPVYNRDDPALLPTPVRMRADPNYTGRGVTVAFLDSALDPHQDLTEPVNRVRAYVDATLTEPEVRPGFKRAEPTSWQG